MGQYLKNAYNTKVTPQTAKIPGSTQVQNNAGGYAWAVDDWQRLKRFLILGSEGGTYYASEQKLTQENTEAVARCITTNGARTVKEIVAISDAGRAPKNDPALLALAMCASSVDQDTRMYAWNALPKVARIGTHLLHFVSYMETMRGWGRMAKNGVGRWYNYMPAEKLAYQAIKYQSRDAWAQRDLLRLSHPKPIDTTHDAIYHWLVKGTDGQTLASEPPTDKALTLLWAFEQAKVAVDSKTIVKLITDYNLPREAIPTVWLKEKDVWAALLVDMPLTAMIRNLATMTRVELLAPFADATSKVIAELTNQDKLTKARVHPVVLLNALKTYQQGHGDKSSHTWAPVAQIVDALDKAFYLSFGNITPTNKRYMLALDVSGSMGMGQIAGMSLNPREASAAMAMVTVYTESQYMTVAFQNNLTPLTITPRMRLDSIINTIDNLPFGGTDCAQPMLYALKNKLPIDVFCVYTDSETWAGAIHPVQALQEYRRKMGVDAKLVVVGMTSGGFSIADPNDKGMLDVVGFDTAMPEMLSMFVRGEI